MQARPVLPVSSAGELKRGTVASDGRTHARTHALYKIGKKNTEKDTKTSYQCRLVLDMHALCQQAMATIHHLESHLLMNEIPYLKGSFGHIFWQVSNDLVLVRKKCLVF
jgi:hypothetical protein